MAHEKKVFGVFLHFLLAKSSTIRGALVVSHEAPSHIVGAEGTKGPGVSPWGPPPRQSVAPGALSPKRIHPWFFPVKCGKKRTELQRAPSSSTPTNTSGVTTVSQTSSPVGDLPAGPVAPGERKLWALVDGSRLTPFTVQSSTYFWPRTAPWNHEL